MKFKTYTPIDEHQAGVWCERMSVLPGVKYVWVESLDEYMDGERYPVFTPEQQRTACVARAVTSRGTLSITTVEQLRPALVVARKFEAAR